MRILEYDFTPTNEVLIKLFSYTKKLEYAFLSNANFGNLSLSEIHIISKIGEIKKATISGLAKAMGVTVSTMTTAANKLFSKGYIVKERSNSDKRIIYVTLSEIGAAAFRAHEKFHKTVAERAIDSIRPQDRGVFAQCLEGILDFFSSENTWDI